jgi:heat-inducible transcriptional repressor
MNDRQEKILDMVVEEYVKNAQPIGSKFLLEIDELACGEATIRNELRFLEEEGYLTHPHTSSGRVPTALGYRHYLQKIDWEKSQLKRKETVALEKMNYRNNDWEMTIKNIARLIAELSQQAVIVSIGPAKIYYTGLSNVFRQPEFSDMAMVNKLSLMFDQCEEYMEGFMDEVENEPKCFIGAEQPFGEVMSLIGSKFGKGRDGAIILVGPIRMDYSRNYNLIKKVIDNLI